MKTRLLTFLILLNLTFSFGQVDTVFMTVQQFNKFESIINKLDPMFLEDEEVYRQDAQFDSLIEVIDYLEGNKEFGKSKEVIQQAKSIYENSCYISYLENPMACSCIFSLRSSYKLKSRLISELELLEIFLEENNTIVSEDEMNLFYSRCIDNYLVFFERLPKYYNTNLESRIWIPSYIEDFRKVKIIVNQKLND